MRSVRCSDWAIQSATRPKLRSPAGCRQTHTDSHVPPHEAGHGLVRFCVLVGVLALALETAGCPETGAGAQSQGRLLDVRSGVADDSSTDLLKLGAFRSRDVQ